MAVAQFPTVLYDASGTPFVATSAVDQARYPATVIATPRTASVATVVSAVPVPADPPIPALLSTIATTTDPQVRRVSKKALRGSQREDD